LDLLSSTPNHSKTAVADYKSLVGTTGVILVDTKSNVDSEKGVIAEIAKVAPKTVNTGVYHAQRQPDYPELIAVAVTRCALIL